MTTPAPARLPRDMRRVVVRGVLLAFVLTLFIDAGALVVPLFDMQLYDRVLQSRNMNTVIMLSVACALGLILFALVDALRGALFAALADRTFTRLSPTLFAGLLDRHAAGDTSGGAELVQDLARVRAFLGSGNLAVPLDALCSPLLLAVLFMLHPAFGWLAICGASLLLLFGLLSDSLFHDELIETEAARTRLANTMRARLAAPELTNALGMLPAIIRHWAGEQARLLRRAARVQGREWLISGCGRLTRLAMQAGVMIAGAILVLDGQTSPGALMGANLLLNKFVNPYDHLASGWRHWTLARASWRRVIACVSESSAQAVLPAPTADGAGLSVQGVTLRGAGGRVLLDDISLHIPPGTAVGLAGSNGSGKSTLLRLLAGAMPPDAGAIRLDGAPVEGRGADIGYLPQEIGLLDGTVARNVARMQDIDPAAVVGAAEAAGAHDMIGRLARGYDTPIRGDGGGLSRGQGQRVALARALFGRPRLLLLDEPDASLDHDGEQELLCAIRAACAQAAIVVVATHRKPLLAMLDRVITLRNGTVAA
jgi:ATP-binding cassette subfamily C protein